MEKPAPTEYPIIEDLKRRWSPRAFSERPVERHKLMQLLEAARWAASSYNEQPWRYIVGTKDRPAEYEKLLGCLVEANQVWARQAPVLMISLMKTSFTKNGKPNRVAMHDVGAASAQLTAQATAMGLFVHQMGGIEIEKIKREYGVPEGFEPVAGIAIGYAGEPKTLPENLRGAETEGRKRMEFEEFVFGERFGEAAGVVKEK